MEMKEAIDRRKSVRAYLQHPVSRVVLEEVLGRALRAPSWGNTQPWRMTVAGPAALRAIIGETMKKIQSGEGPRPDLAVPGDWPTELDRRYRENGRELFKVLGIERGDQERRSAHRLNMFRFFGAPQAIYLHQERTLSAYSVFDAGLLAQNIALLAEEKGLGTCFLAVTVLFPEVIRKHAGIPDTDRILIGMAVGYPDKDALINRFRSGREPLEAVLRWVD